VEYGSASPIVGASVAFVVAGQRWEAVTDAVGGFALRGVPATTGRLLVRADAAVYVEDTRDLALDGRLDVKHDEVALPPIRLVRSDSRPPSARSGVGLAAVNRSGRAVIAYVTPRSPAAEASIHAGDWLIAIDGHDASDL